MGAALSTGLMVLILGGFLQIFMGNEMTDTAMAIGGALLFSLFIIYDTQVSNINIKTRTIIKQSSCR